MQDLLAAARDLQPVDLEGATPSRSDLGLRSEVGAHHVLVHAAPRASGRTRSAFRSRSPRSSGSRRRRGSCRGRRGSPSAPTSAGIFWITSVMWPVSSSGSPAAGSSSSTSRGLPTTARAISTSRRSRALSVPTFAFGGAVSPTNSIAASTSCRAGDALRAGVLVDHRHVVEDRELLDRHLGLERPPQAPARPAVVGHLQQVLAEGGDRPGGRLDESAHHVEEGRLAGAVRADQAAGSALEDDRHAVDRGDASETDGEVVDLDHASALGVGREDRGEHDDEHADERREPWRAGRSRGSARGCCRSRAPPGG